MATAANSDIRRLYSWWWDSHISRKNSKWLEENLKDMDMKVSMMIRLLEEDGDSFAKKAEMYFQKRPELLKLVEEFYRAYRALAERYDHATVALRQAHRTIQEAFPNQIPSTPTEASSDDLQKEAYDVDAPNIVSIKSNGKARKVLNFLEEDGKGCDKADLNYKIEGENGEAISLECQKLSEKISNLELEISRAQEENEKINSELERCQIFEQKVNVLTKQMNERGEEIETLKHRSEEADLKNCSLIEDLHKVEEQNENLSKELRSNQEELEEERILKVKAEEALKSSEKLNLSHQRELKVLFSDLQMKSENLSDLEDKVEKLEVENQSLTAQLLSSTSTIKNLQDEISTLNVTLIRLEEEAKERENEMATLQQKIMVSQGESSDLELKLKCIVDQIIGIGLSEESFQVSVRGIQTENQELKESFEKNEDEKILLNDKISLLERSLFQVTDEFEGLKTKTKSLEEYCDSLDSKNSYLSTENRNLADQLDNSLKDTSKVIGELTERIQSLIQTHEAEKSAHLRSIERETEKGVLLENTLSKTFGELERERETVRSVEMSCASLNVRIQELLSENENFSQQFTNANEDIRVLRDKLQSVNLELEGLRVCFKDKEAALIGQLEKAAEKTTYLEKTLSETLSAVEGLKLEERSLKESCDSLNRRMEEIITENSNLGSSLNAANELIEELRETKAALLGQSVKEREKSTFLEKCLSETMSELDIKRESCDSLNIKIQELSQELTSSAKKMENFSKNYALLENSLCLANGEIEGLREKIQLTRETESGLIVQLEERAEKEKVLEQSLFQTTSELEELKSKEKFLEESSDFLKRKISEVTSENSGLLENNATLHKSLSDAFVEIEAWREKVKGLDESLKSINEENSNLLSEKIALSSELELSCSSVRKVTERLTCSEEKHLNLERQRESTLLQVGELKSSLNLLHQELERLSEEHLDLQIRDFIFERQLLHAKESFSTLERENLEQEKVIESVSRHNENFQDGLQVVLETLGIDYSSKHDISNFQSIIGEFKEIKRVLSDTLDDNFSLILGDTVKSSLMKDLGLDLMHLKSENSKIAEKMLTLKREKHELDLNLMNLKSENGEMTEQLLAVKTEKDKLSQSNAELTWVINESQIKESQQMAQLGALENLLSNHRDQIKQLDEENISLLIEAVSQSFLSLLFEQISVDRGVTLTELTQNSALLETENGILEDLVNSLNFQLETERNLSTEARKKIEVSEDKLNDSLFLIEESEGNIFKLMDEIKFYEEEASKLWNDSQVSEIYVQILEDRMHELIEICEDLEETVTTAHKDSDSLERELASYLPLVLNLQESMRFLEKEILFLIRHYGMKDDLEQETSSANPDLTEKDNPPEQNPGTLDLNGFLGLQRLQHQIESLRELIKSSISSASQNKNKDKAPALPDFVGQGSTNRINSEAEDSMLRLWETAERQTSVTSSELMGMKGDVDRISHSGKVNSRRDWSRRISNRLSSDALRLLALQNSIEELKTQLERSLTSVDKSTELKYAGIIGRLNRVNDAVSELVNINDGSARRAETLTRVDVDQKKQVAEEVQSGSEKIGRLEMEIQKVQYVVLKVKEEREEKVKGGVRRSRTLLRDYFYGRGKGSGGRRLWICASCIRPDAVRN